MQHLFSAETGEVASSELDDYESLEDDDPNCAGPPAKRLAGVVISDSIAEEPQDDEDTNGVSNDPVMPTPQSTRIDSSKKYDSFYFTRDID
jgi:hypothetical protein